MRSAVGQAQSAATTAANTGDELGAEAQGIGSTLTPFLTQELEHPQGYSQQDESAMLASGLSGAGGATSAIAGKATQDAATSRNAGGMQAVLDDAARSRAKGAAGASEDIAAKGADLKTQQQQDAARGLQGMYGTDTSGMLDATGQIAKDADVEAQAGTTGWMQQVPAFIKSLQSLGAGVGGAG